MQKKTAHLKKMCRIKKKTPVCFEYLFCLLAWNTFPCANAPLNNHKIVPDVHCLSFPDQKGQVSAITTLVEVERMEFVCDCGGCTCRVTFAFGVVCLFSNWPQLEWFKVNSGQSVWYVRASVSTAVALGFPPKPRRVLVPQRTLQFLLYIQMLKIRAQAMTHLINLSSFAVAWACAFNIWRERTCYFSWQAVFLNYL